ncbi:MAG: prolyl oligopeptidase family serine peptidase [Bacteroidales bacterium]|nr:prolyl oligopeptidase family serine peptidase [Bacteroidales bacterium]
MLKNILSLALTALCTSAMAQEFKDYGTEREFPACLDQMQATLTYPMAWGNSPIKQFDLWRNEARSCVLDAMLMAPPAATDRKTEVIATERRKGYEARKLRFNLSEFTRAEAYYLVPDGEGPHPTVILLHDHGGHYVIGKEKMVRPFACPDSIKEDADWWLTKCYGTQYVGDYLAQHGYAVFVTDALYWGDRARKEGRRKEQHMRMAGNLMELGYCWSGIMAYDDIYTADFVATLPEVDASRIACMGHSMGGYRTWMLAAMSDRIKAGVAVCWMVTTDVQCSWEYGNEWGGFANTLPGIKRYMDYPHIASMACPKPMYFINGKKDKLFQPVGVEKAYRYMHSVWDSQGAGQNLKTELWDMPHWCGNEVQEAALQFLDEHLKH